MLPLIGSGAWVEFEQGDPDYPIWVGCFPGARDVPALALTGNPISPRALCCKPSLQNTLMISDVAGPTVASCFKTATGAIISLNDVGITISNGKGAIINMQADAPSLDVNERCPNHHRVAQMII